MLTSMPAVTADDGSEDVNDFLQRIKEMGDQRDREDEERTRKLEEEITQGRKERQARRAERARSLSPTKDASTPSGTPNAPLLDKGSLNLDSHSLRPHLSPLSGTQSADMDATPRIRNDAKPDPDTQGSPVPSQEHLPSPEKLQNTSSISPSNAMAPSRSNTLSWQQRPSSRGSTTGSVRSRPLSSLPSQRDVLKPLILDAPTPQTSDDGLSRNQIAQSLAAKDPSFFKQTQDRGSASVAYKKGQTETFSDTGSRKENKQLPGMVIENLASKQFHQSSPQGSNRENTSSVGGSTSAGIVASNNKHAIAPMSFKGESSPPLPPSKDQHLETRSAYATSSIETGEEPPFGRALAMSPSQGRISTERSERPASPTKGLGGFVQSAMMKRSDSVNKRWSAQAGPGISRENSVASSRSGLDGAKFPVGGITPLVDSRNSVSREATPSASSRPMSNHSSINGIKLPLDNQTTAAGLTSRPRDLGNPISTSEPSNLTEKISTTPPRPSSPTKGEPIMSPPSSPSKKWSPTKPSWLENAISKPEPPKILSPSASQQPTWMADFQRSKQQRGSVDPVKGPAYKEVAVGGLIRSPPPGTAYKPPHIAGLPSGLRSETGLKPRTGSSGDMRSSETLGYMRETDKLSGSSTSPNLSQGGDDVRTPPVANFESSQKRSSGLVTKTKPATPPKKERRSSSKSEEASGHVKDNPEPEFKNVFGKLRKTQTQNYVAPDELKDNIMRGKSGLAKTDGPQKSNIKDDFKESILKKKQGMAAPSASTRITSATSKSVETSKPEAIAKRQGLGRPRDIVSNGKPEARAPASDPDHFAEVKSSQEDPTPAAPKKEVIAPIAHMQVPEKPKPGRSTGFASSLAGILQKGPSPSANVGKSPPASSENEEPGRSAAARPAVNQQSQTGPELTHATKGRARGPKRKPPASIKQVHDASSSIASYELPSKLGVAKKMSATTSPTTKGRLSPDSSAPQPLATIASNKNNVRRQTSQSNTLHKPPTSPLTIPSSRPFSKSAQQPIGWTPSKESSPRVQEPTQSQKTSENQNTAALSSPQTNLQLPAPNAFKSTPQDVHILPVARPSEEDPAQQSIKGITVSRGRSPDSTQSSETGAPNRLPLRRDEEATMADTGLQPKEVLGLGIETPPRPAQTSHQDAASLFVRSPRSPPVPGKKPATIDTKSSSASSPFLHRTLSPPKAPPISATTFREMFDEPPATKTKINVDCQAILNKAPSSDLEKIKTLRKQIFEITDNGKAVPIPPQQEHILFEDSLYVCTHVFGTPAGTRTTETYLWCGDGVSPSAIEDAQLFAKKTAKDNNGRLIILQQGKETARFFQALGGIVITRKGSSSRSDTAIYILCGRQHLGQIAFDEVDLQPQSLCTGFPYIISARGGRLFLWKGKGAGADELGCARLIGMDLGLTGEIEEIDEGREPSDFWSSFPANASRNIMIPSISQHWQLKPSCDRYATKLFTVDVEVPRPKSSSGFMSWGRRESAPANEAGGVMEAKIKEVTPFSQRDLSDDAVFVLDSFFEIFVVHALRTSLNPAPQHRSTKGACLSAALLFAQDYGILAASAEDRPFVPHGSVVILARNDGGPKGLGEGEVPDGMKRCFRKWDSGGIGGGDVKVLSLTEALASKER